MKYFYTSLIGFASAFVASMGLGGGGVLMLYLSAFTNISQLKAQGINLIFFLPIGLASIITHLKNRLINIKVALFMVIGAVPFAALGASLSPLVSQDLLRKILAVFLMFLGAREFVNSFKKKERHTQ